jgi:adenylate cyclase
VQHGEILTWSGEPQEGIDWVLKAMRLNPYHPERFWNHLGRAYFVARRYADAAQAFGRISAADHTHHAFLAASLHRCGDDVAAARHARAVLALTPDFRTDDYLATLHYRHDADREHHRQCLLDAGLPA